MTPSNELIIEESNTLEEKRIKKITEFCKYLKKNGYEYTIKKSEETTLEHYTSDRVGIGA